MSRAHSFSETYRTLAAAQKGRARSAPAYSVYVNRPLGRVFAAAGHGIGMTPDQASLISIACSVLGMLLLVLAPATAPVGVLVAVFLAAGYAWDSSDGQLARLRGGGSRRGEWLDHLLDSFKNAALHLAVLIGMWRWFELTSAGWLLIPIAFTITATVTFAGMLLNDLLAGAPRPRQDPTRGVSVRSLLNLPVDYGTVCWVFVLWGWPVLFVTAYGLLALASALFCVAACLKWYRAMAPSPVRNAS